MTTRPLNASERTRQQQLLQRQYNRGNIKHLLGLLFNEHAVYMCIKMIKIGLFYHKTTHLLCCQCW